MTRLTAVFVLALTGMLRAQTPARTALTTVPERTAYRETSRYADVMAFLKDALLGDAVKTYPIVRVR